MWDITESGIWIFKLASNCRKIQIRAEQEHRQHNVAAHIILRRVHIIKSTHVALSTVRLQPCHFYNYIFVSSINQNTRQALRFWAWANKPQNVITICCLFCRKRAESEARKGSLPNSKEMPLHHPTDPVELRRLNFQTPGRYSARRLWSPSVWIRRCVICNVKMSQRSAADSDLL